MKTKKKKKKKYKVRRRENERLHTRVLAPADRARSSAHNRRPIWSGATPRCGVGSSSSSPGCESGNMRWDQREARGGESLVAGVCSRAPSRRVRKSSAARAERPKTLSHHFFSCRRCTGSLGRLELPCLCCKATRELERRQ